VIETADAVDKAVESAANVLQETVPALAGYVRAAARALAERDIRELRLGNLGFPDPADLDKAADNGALASKDNA